MDQLAKAIESGQTPEQREAWAALSNEMKQLYVYNVRLYLRLLDIFDTHGVPADLIAVKLKELGIETTEVELRAAFAKLVPVRAKLKSILKLARATRRNCPDYD